MFDLKLPEKVDENDKNHQELHDLDTLSEAELLDLRAKIDALLPVKRLSDMSLEEEMVLQYRQVKALQSFVLSSDTVDPNKKASVANSCASALENLVKMQERYHHAERLKQIETNLINLLNTWPQDQVKVFFDQYEALKI